MALDLHGIAPLLQVFEMPVSVLPSVAPYGMKQLYLQDPDRYELCFQWKA